MRLFCFYFLFFSSAFGFTLLAMLASCLLHLVATTYFLFVEILGDNVRLVHERSESDTIILLLHLQDIFVSSLQLLWCVFHTSRLLLIVEPCHKTSIEVDSVVTIILHTEALITLYFCRLVEPS